MRDNQHTQNIQIKWWNLFASIWLYYLLHSFLISVFVCGSFWIIFLYAIYNFITKIILFLKLFNMYTLHVRVECKRLWSKCNEPSLTILITDLHPKKVVHMVTLERSPPRYINIIKYVKLLIRPDESNDWNRKDIRY